MYVWCTVVAVPRVFSSLIAASCRSHTAFLCCCCFLAVVAKHICASNTLSPCFDFFLVMNEIWCKWEIRNIHMSWSIEMKKQKRERERKYSEARIMIYHVIPDSLFFFPVLLWITHMLLTCTLHVPLLLFTFPGLVSNNAASRKTNKRQRRKR